MEWEAKQRLIGGQVLNCAAAVLLNVWTGNNSFESHTVPIVTAINLLLRGYYVCFLHIIIIFNIYSFLTCRFT